MKVYLIPLLVLIVDPVFAIEKLECGGTEPFWSAVFADQQITFELSGDQQQDVFEAGLCPGGRCIFRLRYERPSFWQNWTGDRLYREPNVDGSDGQAWQGTRRAAYI